ncbi:16S rRNA (guanine(966)-N(2))-methyltransferase RsmD [Carnobacterium mobile]|uniref:16S rRNA (guanine(966)-N(2))-methyltransferase RsmD n=1 Tax=Carnobacterium mobile TaxID=2750 RepID=UPI001867F080|nr:16S rRNA (guanine(966)-N(2))-methyltransferase RsmD [Carnobacterium mobile]
MRVISGEYGGRKLKAVPGKNTRPTTDKVKESLFNIIGPYFDGGTCLDLFAGSGSLAIEAVSRGMEHAVLIDKDLVAIKTIKENIEMTKETSKFEVFRNEANRSIDVLIGRKKSFDLLFLDPPYLEQEIVQQLEKIMTGNLLADKALIICEVSRKIDLPTTIGIAEEFRTEIYGASKVVLYEVIKEGGDKGD